MDAAVLGLALALTPLLSEDPPLSDLANFPDFKTAQKNRIFADEYINHLRFIWYTEQHQLEAIDWHLSQARPNRRAWDLLEDAQSDWFTPCRRRQILGDLRRHVGPANYYRWAMPPPVPLHIFVPID